MGREFERGTLTGDLMGSIEGLRKVAGELERLAREIAWAADDMGSGRSSPRATERAARSILPGGLPPVLDELEDIYDRLSTIRRLVAPLPETPAPAPSPPR